MSLQMIDIDERNIQCCRKTFGKRSSDEQRYPAHELTAIIKHLLPEDSLKKPVSEFSGGMKRRTAILRAILAPADIVLMDEPFTGLDPDTKQQAARSFPRIGSINFSNKPEYSL